MASIRLFCRGVASRQRVNGVFVAALSTISRMPSLPAQASDGASRISTPHPTPSPSDAL